MIRVKELTKRYGPTKALNGVSFEVERGEVVGFLGPNGAGKSTTLRILAGFLPATSGEASVAGHEVAGDSIEARRNLGYLPENVPLYPEMRVEEYLSFRASLKGVPRRERKGRVAYVMDRCAIADVRRKMIGALSKGYRQRVGLAESLVHDPPVLILDEPTIGLDPSQIRQVREIVRDLGREHTILLSTHILPEVEMVCGRVMIIHGGRLLYQSSLADMDREEGGRRIVLEIRAPAGAAAERLRTVPGVVGVKERPDGESARFELTVSKGADPRAEISRCVTENEWSLRELRWERVSLEDIFIRLTAMDAAAPEKNG